jgi:4-carboxymuconolactone decarboxylase
MDVVAKADVDEATRTALAELALGDPELLGESLALRAELQARSGLDPRSFALVKIAALESGATPQDLIGVLLAITPQIGGPRAVAAAPELMVALGLALPDGV